MAAVTILQDPICSDSASEIPRAKWPILLRQRRAFCRLRLPDKDLTWNMGSQEYPAIA